MAKKLEEKRVEGKKGAFVGFWTLLNWCVDQLDIILAGGVAVSPPHHKSCISNMVRIFPLLQSILLDLWTDLRRCLVIRGLSV